MFADTLLASRASWLAACGLLWASVMCAAAGGEDAAPSRDEVTQFEQRIRPLLVRRCYSCHSEDAETLQGGLRLDTRAGIVDGGDSGPVVVAGNPDESLLIQSVRYEAGGFEMPPSGPLPPEEIALLVEWVRRGAPLPDAKTDAAVRKSEIDFAQARAFWAFQPPRRSTPPDVRTPGWIERPIDAFVLAELERQGLSPSAAADRRTLIRRAYFDLLGLPPTPDEVERFIADESPNAYPRLVDRLLASPHYGERWGRYWLDLARYSDKTASWLDSIAQAWLYRDWVVTALNHDVSYDDFVRRQLATDLMPESGPEDMPALGFLGLSPVYWKELMLDKEVIKGTVAEEWEERIDTIGRTFLGLSIACARCHDHKFDPISTEDYYAMAGVLASTRLIDRPTIPEADAQAVQSAREQVREWREQIDQLRATDPPSTDVEPRIAELEQRIARLESETPGYHAPWAHAVDDAALYVLEDGPNATKLEYREGEPRDLHVHIRGNPSNLGPLIPRRFLTVLCDEAPRPFADGSGRRELADAMVTDAAPLSARVIVNRVWKHHFGRGLVETVSDFGVQGARPTHPQMLDDLTARFIENGWSLKWLHREIMLSAVYRQRSAYDAANDSVDPENRFLWRMTRRRLEIEAWRDAMLVATGELDRQLGGAPRALQEPSNYRRTLYGLVERYELDDMLRLYDFPDPLTHSPSRNPTITPIQQLFVLNSPFVQQRAVALAERVKTKHPGEVKSQIRHAYRLLFQRAPNPAELTLGVEFLAPDAGSEPAADRWPQYAQALLGGNEFWVAD